MRLQTTRSQVAIVVDVCTAHTHAGLLLAIVVNGASGPKADVHEPTVTLVAPQDVRLAVIGDEDIELPVEVIITHDDAQRCPVQGIDPGRGGDVLEGAVAPVVVEPVRGRDGVVFRGAVVFSAEPRVAGDFRLRRPSQVIADIEVEVSVGVVVQEGGGGPPAGVTHAG